MEVIVAPLTDQQNPIPNIRTRTYFIVGAHLDANSVKNGLDKLIREHWRKLGGRLVKNLQTNLWEYHVPPAFVDGYEIFKWSQQETDEPLEKITPVPRAPSSGDLVFLAPTTEFGLAFYPSDWPYHLADDPPNSPILYVHLSLFADASVLAISSPHVIGDQMGLRNLVNAWLGMLDGKTPPPMSGLGNDDPLPNQKQYADYEKHEVRRKGKMRIRGPFEYFFVLLGFMNIALHPKEVDRTAFFSHSLVRSLRNKIIKEIKEKHGRDVGISDNDVLIAIFAKFSRMHTKSPRMMNLSQTMNLRGRVPKLSGSEGDGFIRNALIYPSSRFYLTSDMPISEIAYHNRMGLQELMEPGATDRSLAVIREMVRRKQPIHTCEPLETSYSMTNWCAAWKDLDFTSAVAVDEKGSKECVKPELRVFGVAGERNKPHRHHAMVMYRSDEGYWCDIGFSERTFKAVKEYIAKDPRLEKL